ncbi:39635_t:CDS:1, partial [Gigaspora margarita]
ECCKFYKHFKEKHTSIQTKPTEKQQILQNIPELVAAISNINPLIKITESLSSINKLIF